MADKKESHFQCIQGIPADARIVDAYVRRSSAVGEPPAFCIVVDSAEWPYTEQEEEFQPVFTTIYK